MWEISMFSDDFYTRDRAHEDNLALLQKVGVGYVELRIVDGVNIMDLTDDELDTLEGTLAKYDMRVAGLGTPIFKCPLRGQRGPEWGSRHGFGKESGYEEHLALLPRAFEIADKLGAANVRCFPFWREYKLDEVLDEVVEKLGRAARRAEQLGHSLVVENEHNQLAGTGVELARILKAVNSPHLTGIYDVGNSWRRGGNISDDLNALRGWISHVHIKHSTVDILCGNQSYRWVPSIRDDTGGPAFTRVGAWNRTQIPISGRLRIGDTTVEVLGRTTFIPVTDSPLIDYRMVLYTLKEHGYDGFLAFDNDYRNPQAEENLQMTVDALRKLVTEVWGGR